MSSPPPLFLASRLRHVNGETRPDALMQWTCYPPSFVYFFQPFSRRRRLGFISTASRGPRNGRTFPASKLACRRRRACWNINAYSLAAHGNDGLGTTRMVAGTPGVCVVMSKSCTISIISDLTVNGRNAGRFTMRLVTLP